MRSTRGYDILCVYNLFYPYSDFFIINFIFNWNFLLSYVQFMLLILHFLLLQSQIQLFGPHPMENLDRWILNYRQILTK